MVLGLEIAPKASLVGGLKESLALQKSIGAISGDVDVEKLIDTRFLPADAKFLK